MDDRQALVPLSMFVVVFRAAHDCRRCAAWMRHNFGRAARTLPGSRVRGGIGVVDDAQLKSRPEITKPMIVPTATGET